MPIVGETRNGGLYIWGRCPVCKAENWLVNQRNLDVEVCCYGPATRYKWTNVQKYKHEKARNQFWFPLKDFLKKSCRKSKAIG